MKIDSYKISGNKENLIFVFSSNGPKGIIPKVVVYEYISKNIYNLAFGDYDLNTETINDYSNSNNEDGRKVLATVIATLDKFYASRPKEKVLFRGSTARRTKIYQRIIKEYYNEFKDKYLIHGYNEGSNYPEEIDFIKNYVQFRVTKR